MRIGMQRSIAIPHNDVYIFMYRLVTIKSHRLWAPWHTI